MAAFPSEVVAEIAARMTDTGGLVGFGSTWEVSVGVPRDSLAKKWLSWSFTLGGLRRTCGWRTIA